MRRRPAGDGGFCVVGFLCQSRSMVLLVVCRREGERFGFCVIVIADLAAVRKANFTAVIVIRRSCFFPSMLDLAQNEFLDGQSQKPHKPHTMEDVMRQTPAPPPPPPPLLPPAELASLIVQVQVVRPDVPCTAGI
ncbi:unnamed protein product [Soboliphyme baturini]|uniref:Uncharacterized protein n=1 Tax=Soboliphyme baturini TaxID=241478 RepID=A0A183IK59_9BILA|nr:unnamed protein product [Soboliphyme baturini]